MNTIRIKGIMVNLDAPFKDKAGIVASGIFSSLSDANQSEAVNQLCDALGYKSQAVKPKPAEQIAPIEEPDTAQEKPL